MFTFSLFNDPDVGNGWMDLIFMVLVYHFLLTSVRLEDEIQPKSLLNSRKHI